MRELIEIGSRVLLRGGHELIASSDALPARSEGSGIDPYVKFNVLVNEDSVSPEQYTKEATVRSSDIVAVI